MQESASVLILNSNHPETLVYLCRRQKDKVLVMLNFSKTDSSIHFDHPAVFGEYTDLFSQEKSTLYRTNRFDLAAGEFKVLHETHV